MPNETIAILGKDAWVEQGAQALQDFGYNIKLIEVDANNLKNEDIISEIQKIKPTFCYTRNLYIFNNPSTEAKNLHAFFLENKIPVVSLFLDNPESTQALNNVALINDAEFKNLHLFLCTDKTFLPYFKKRGLRSYYSPHCANKNLSEIKSNLTYNHDLCFVGTCPKTNFSTNQYPVSHDELFEFSVIQLLIDIASIHQWGDSGDINNPHYQNLKKTFQSISLFFKEDFWDPIKYQSYKNNLLGSLSKEITSFNQESLMRLDFVYSYYQLIDSLRKLLPHGIKIYGGDNWKLFFGDYQKSYNRIEYYKELPTVFSSTKINFCITKMQYVGAVHDRPLTVFASGGFALTDYRSDMEDMFKKDEIIGYKNFEEALSLKDYFLKNETKRKELIEKARKRIFLEHTYHHRMQDLISILKKEGVLK